MKVRLLLLCTALAALASGTGYAQTYDNDGYDDDNSSVYAQDQDDGQSYDDDYSDEQAYAYDDESYDSYGYDDEQDYMDEEYMYFADSSYYVDLFYYDDTYYLYDDEYWQDDYGYDSYAAYEDYYDDGYADGYSDALARHSRPRINITFLFGNPYFLSYYPYSGFYGNNCWGGYHCYGYTPYYRWNYWPYYGYHPKPRHNKPPKNRPDHGDLGPVRPIVGGPRPRQNSTERDGRYNLPRVNSAPIGTGNRPSEPQQAQIPARPPQQRAVWTRRLPELRTDTPTWRERDAERAASRPERTERTAVRSRQRDDFVMVSGPAATEQAPRERRFERRSEVQRPSVVRAEPQQPAPEFRSRTNTVERVRAPAFEARQPEIQRQPRPERAVAPVRAERAEGRRAKAKDDV